MSFKLTKLPWAANALEPYITANTIGFHYGKHHQTYVTKLNELVKGTQFETKNLTQIVRETAGQSQHTPIFNNAAQDWNHSFYWNSIKPQGGSEPNGPVKDLINKAFGNYTKFHQTFKDAALAQFGSGWTWLAEKDGKVTILKTSNADNPLTQGYRPLITLDVWEHAYYLDYQNRRVDYATVFLDKLINWDYANANLQAKEVTI